MLAREKVIRRKLTKFMFSTEVKVLRVNIFVKGQLFKLGLRRTYTLQRRILRVKEMRGRGQHICGRGSTHMWRVSTLHIRFTTYLHSTEAYSGGKGKEVEGEGIKIYVEGVNSTY